MFLLRQGASSFREGILRFRNFDRGPPDLKDRCGNNQQTDRSGGQSAAAEQPGKPLPPGNISGASRGGHFDDAFLFELSAERNPDAGGRVEFRRQLPRRRNNVAQIRNQILASVAGSEVSAHSPWERRNPFLFEDELYFFTLHDQHSARRDAGEPSRQTSRKLCGADSPAPRIGFIVAQSPGPVCVFAA
jgi:hypothetical protein